MGKSGLYSPELKRRRAELIRSPTTALTILLCLTCGGASAGDGAATIDTHMHLLIPSQGPTASGTPRLSRRRPPAGAPSSGDAVAGYLAAAESLIARMDREGVDRVLLMPPPQIPEQAGRVDNTWEHCLAVAQKYPGRIVPVGGGAVLNPLIHSIPASAVTAGDRARFEQEAEKLVRAGVKAFGEMSVLHLAMQEKHNYSEAPADHPLFLLLADIAARHGLPIDIHMEATLEEMATPPALAGVSHNPRVIPATVPGFERLLAHNRQARIVWQHAGWDNTGQKTPELLRRLLAEHPNLFLALRVEEKRRPFAPNRPVADDGRIEPEWRRLIEDFPDRFVLGSDEFVGMPGRDRRMPQSFALTWSLLEQIPSDLARKVGRENPARIYGLTR